MVKKQGKIRVGISGWTYPPWRGVFYPAGLKIKDELNYASRQLGTIEINGTFYALQKPKTFFKWYDDTPENFCFSVKAGKYMTHVRRLKEVRQPLGHFLASGVLCLREKLGPILWQFPPTMIWKDDRFEEFFSYLPKTFSEALRLAVDENEFFPEFNDHVKELEKFGDRPLHHTFEFRNESFYNQEFIGSLHKAGHALTIADCNNEWPYVEDITSDIVYVRLHGYGKIYEGGYTDEALKVWLERILAWAGGKPSPGQKTVTGLDGKGKPKDVFIYFDNTMKDEAPKNALRLTEMVKRRLAKD
jgi:uncharacterized protein YecE (DUF72 family)